MKFKLTPIPTSGSSRIIRKFLFLPLRIKREVRWLEFAHIKQIRMDAWFGSSRVHPAYWEDVEWIEDLK